MRPKTISFCFDDGFLASSQKTRQIFERQGVRATFCVMAAPEQSRDSAHINGVFADWAFWRGTLGAGHDVAPHGWAHERLMDLPFEEGRESIERTLEIFQSSLPGFRAEQCVFHAAYLQLPPDLLAMLLAKFSAVRLAQGNGGTNMIGCSQSSGLIDCITFGPHDVAAMALSAIERFHAGSRDWLVLVLHGLDGEGWGSIAAAKLEQLLGHCLDKGLIVQPVKDVLATG